MKRAEQSRGNTIIISRLAAAPNIFALCLPGRSGRLVDLALHPAACLAPTTMHSRPAGQRNPLYLRRNAGGARQREATQ